MNQGLRWRFSVMMFLEYMIWGAWFPDFSVYMKKIGFSDPQSGFIYSLLPIGCMVAPFIGGQLADRYFASEKLIGVLHLLGGGFLFAAAGMTSYDQLWPVMLAWALVYAPTLALTNSLCFHHMPEAEKEFGLVRVWGTIGWIIVGWLLAKVVRGALAGTMNSLGGFDGLWMAGVFSILLGVFSFFLPHTPAQKKGENPWAFLEALKMLRDPQFAIFITIAFVVATELMFYFVLTAPFLEASGITPGQTPKWMTIAQIAEIGTMLALPWMLTHWGVRKTMVIGILAWPVRYAIFAIGNPLWLVIAALSLHGLCYVCFFTVAYIYVNQVAEADIKASAQGLITFVTLGVGLFIGSNFAGYISNLFTETAASGGPVVNYTKVFLVPLVLTVICAVIFTFAFRDRAVKQAQVEPAG